MSPPEAGGAPAGDHLLEGGLGDLEVDRRAGQVEEEHVGIHPAKLTLSLGLPDETGDPGQEVRQRVAGGAVKALRVVQQLTEQQVAAARAGRGEATCHGGLRSGRHR